jgi:hypothetical protein
MRYLSISIKHGLAVAVVFCLVVAGATAVSITTSSDQITKGDTVSLAIQDLKDHSVFTFRITGIFPVTPGGNFTFEANSFQLPFSLTKSTIHADLQNTDTNVFDVKKGDTEVRKIGRSKGGSYSVDQNYNISGGVYDFMTMSGTASPDTNSVTVNLEMTGTKAGLDDGTISFLVGGIETGTVVVNAMVNGSTVLSKTIVVIAPVTQTGTVITPTTSSGGSMYAAGSGRGIVEAVIPIENTTGVPEIPITSSTADVLETITSNTSMPVLPVKSLINVTYVTLATTSTTPVKVTMVAGTPFLSFAIAGGLLSKRIRKK